MLSEIAMFAFLIAASASSRMMLEVVPPEEFDLYRWTLMPLIGSAIGAVGAFCLNTEPENRKVVLGRCAFAFSFGIIGARGVYLLLPWDAPKETLSDPLILIGMGIVICSTVYVLVYPFFRRFYKQAPEIARRQVEAYEREVLLRQDRKPTREADKETEKDVK